MLSKSINPFLCCKDMITDLLSGLPLEPRLSLCFDHLFEETRIDCAHHIDKILPRWSLCCSEVIMKISFDLVITLGLCNQVIHLELTIEGQSNTVDLVILEA